MAASSRPFRRFAACIVVVLCAGAAAWVCNRESCEALWTIDLPFRPEKVAIDPGRREIAVTGGGIFARVSGNGRILELCRLPGKAELLWHSSGKWYAACGERIFKLD